VRSGLVTEGLASLAERNLLLGPAVAAYAWGGERLATMRAEGSLQLRGVEEVHDLSTISATEGFVALNTALEVGLDGSANVETLAGRLVAGPGGHPDFAAGASRSPGGMSVVALRSGPWGSSGIVPKLQAVSTPGVDIDVVVTEHGVADLRGRDRRERAQLLAAVAGPDRRGELEAQVAQGLG